METKGLNRVIKHMRAMHDNIDDDIDFILEMNAKEGVGIAQKKAKEVMVKGYWTGNLWRQIEYQKVGKLHHRVISNAYYSGYLEFGTRDMNKEPFMFPTYEVLTQNQYNDLKRLLNG
ncbi:HK97-gp10 family putative phage morphogenesis protein [Staphylococcus hominis]|uniref:HK97-gp10 family putative phage morphogenesis protein n=1 Tax=Staphylococcus hominis TaxID=1290 RepID=UPI0031C5FD15